MLEIYSTVHRHLNHKLNSQSSTFETTHLKQLPLNTFVIHTNFKPVNFSKKLKPLRIGPYKIPNHLSEVTYELLSQDGSTFQTHRNHILPYYPKEPIIFPYIKHYRSTPSLINNPDTEPYQDTFSRFSSLDSQQNSNHSQTLTFSKHKQFNNLSTSIPKYQNFSHYSSLQDKLDILPYLLLYTTTLRILLFKITLIIQFTLTTLTLKCFQIPFIIQTPQMIPFLSSSLVLLILLILPPLLYSTLKMNLLINELLIPHVIYVHSLFDIIIHPNQTSTSPLD